MISISSKENYETLYDFMLFRAPSKINLTLDVFDKKERTDGYHNLDSLVVPLSEPADELRIHIKPASDKTSITLTCNDPKLPVDNRNLAYRAAHIYLMHIGKPFEIKIDLRKRIPTEAGLGGGSSDAAAILRAMNAYFNHEIEMSTLIKLAASLGSDVPLFLAEKPIRMRGCGEILESLDFELPEIYGILVHPGIGVSTAHAYSALDTMPNRRPGNSTEKLVMQLKNNKDKNIDTHDLLAAGVSNDFESVIFNIYPDIAQVYEKILTVGALRALLCGSGSAVFGLARDIEHAKQLFDLISVYFPLTLIVSSASADTFKINQF